MGYLVTLLALARFFAPVPSDVEADAAAPAPVEGPASADGESETPILRKVVFLPGVIDGNRAPADLRNPFKARKLASPDAKAQTKSGAKTTRVRHDLRDPFATKPRKQRRLEPAPDLRDPFVQPKRALPKCPDTGGVPIQRPDSVDPGCATASLRVILANR